MRMISRMPFLLAGLLAGLIAGLLLPSDQRLKLSQQLAGSLGRIAGQMPDG